MGNRRGFASLPALLGKSTLSSCGGLYPALTGLVASLSLTGFVWQQAAHAGVGYAVSLVAVLTAAGCLAGLLVLVSRGLPYRPGKLLEAPTTTAQSADAPGEDWPLLVALLFGPLPVLLAGLGGWV